MKPMEFYQMNLYEAINLAKSYHHFIKIEERDVTSEAVLVKKRRS